VSRNEQTNSSDNEGKSKDSKIPESLKNLNRLTFRSCEAAEPDLYVSEELMD
jgi:hypothetical protein